MLPQTKKLPSLNSLLGNMKPVLTFKSQLFKLRFNIIYSYISLLEFRCLLKSLAMRSNAGMANRHGDVDLCVRASLLPQLTLWLGLAWSSVGIATDYGLDGPGSNPGGDEIFRPSRPALGPTQSPVKWVPSLSRG